MDYSIRSGFTATYITLGTDCETVGGATPQNTLCVYPAAWSEDLLVVAELDSGKLCYLTRPEPRGDGIAPMGVIPVIGKDQKWIDRARLAVELLWADGELPDAPFSSVCDR